MAVEMSGINSAGEMENVYVPCVLSVHTIPLSKSTFPHFLLLSPSSALASHSFSHPSFSFPPSRSIFFWCIAFSFLRPLSLSPSCFFYNSLSLSLCVPVLFCPSGVWDSRQCWEAYGLLIKKQGGTRPQLTRTHTHTHRQTFALLYL